MHLLYACREGWFKVVPPNLAILSINKNSLLAVGGTLASLQNFDDLLSFGSKTLIKTVIGTNSHKERIVIDIL